MCKPICSLRATSFFDSIKLSAVKLCNRGRCFSEKVRAKEAFYQLLPPFPHFEIFISMAGWKKIWNSSWKHVRPTLSYKTILKKYNYCNHINIRSYKFMIILGAGMLGAVNFSISHTLHSRDSHTNIRPPSPNLVVHTNIFDHLAQTWCIINIRPR